MTFTDKIRSSDVYVVYMNLGSKIAGRVIAWEFMQVCIFCFPSVIPFSFRPQLFALPYSSTPLLSYNPTLLLLLSSSSTPLIPFLFNYALSLIDQRSSEI